MKLAYCFLLYCTLQVHATSLKEAYKQHFELGVALNINEQLIKTPKQFTSLITSQFNSLVAENSMKWSSINPQPGIYKFKASDRLVNFAQEHQLGLVGHVLFWHNQTPDWVFHDSQGRLISKDQLQERMRRHIRTLNDRYGNKIQAWDVVNEALNEDGSLRDSPWKKILGDDWVVQAFQIAHEELDPKTQLIYNDFNLVKNAKLDGLIKLLKQLQQKGIRIDAVGIQAHWRLDYPKISSIETAIKKINALGLKIHFSELDIDVLPRPKNFKGGADIKESHLYKQDLNPYPNELPTTKQNELAKRYHQLFRLFVKHADKVNRVTFWGLSDAFSWKNNWPVPNRTNYPLLFDRQGKPKPAYYRVLEAVKEQALLK